MSTRTEPQGSPGVYLTKYAMLMTTVGLFNTSVGTAVLSVPKAVADCGLVLFVVLLFGFALVAQYGCWLVVQSLEMRQGEDLDPLKLSEFAFGGFGKWFTLAMAFLDAWGSTVAFFRTIADIVRPVLLVHCAASDCAWATHGFIIGLVAILVYPMMLSTDISEISWVNMLSVASLLAFGSAILANLLHQYVGFADLPAVDISNDAVVALTVIAFAYDGCQMNMFPFYRDMPPPRYGTKASILSRISCVSNMAAATTYLLVALMSYATFGSSVGGDVMNSFTNTGFLLVTIKISFAMQLMFSIPVTLFECSNVLREHVLGSGSTMNAVLNFLLVGSAAWLAVSVPSMYTAFAYVGATTGTVWAFILPAMWFVGTADRVYSRQSSGEDVEATTESTPLVSERRRRRRHPHRRGSDAPMLPPPPSAASRACAQALLACGVICVPIFVYITYLSSIRGP